MWNGSLYLPCEINLLFKCWSFWWERGRECVKCVAIYLFCLFIFSVWLFYFHLIVVKYSWWGTHLKVFWQFGFPRPLNWMWWKNKTGCNVSRFPVGGSSVQNATKHSNAVSIVIFTKWGLVALNAVHFCAWIKKYICISHLVWCFMWTVLYSYNIKLCILQLVISKLSCLVLFFPKNWFKDF